MTKVNILINNSDRYYGRLDEWCAEGCIGCVGRVVAAIGVEHRLEEVESELSW